MSGAERDVSYTGCNKASVIIALHLLISRYIIWSYVILGLGVFVCVCLYIFTQQPTRRNEQNISIYTCGISAPLQSNWEKKTKTVISNFFFFWYFQVNSNSCFLVSLHHIITPCDLIIFLPHLSISLLTRMHKAVPVCSALHRDKGEIDCVEDVAVEPVSHVRRRYQRWNNGRNRCLESVRGDEGWGWGWGWGGYWICWYDQSSFETLIKQYFFRRTVVEGARSTERRGACRVWKRESDINLFFFFFHNISEHPPTLSQKGKICKLDLTFKDTGCVLSPSFLASFNCWCGLDIADPAGSHPLWVKMRLVESFQSKFIPLCGALPSHHAREETCAPPLSNLMTLLFIFALKSSTHDTSSIYRQFFWCFHSNPPKNGEVTI